MSVVKIASALVIGALSFQVSLPAQAQQQPAAATPAPEAEYQKPRRAPRQHIHYEGDGHDHSRDRKRSAHHHAGHGHAHKPGEKHDHDHGVFDAEALFAFTSVSRIGDKGDRHVILSLDGAWDRRDGTFRALTPKAEFGFNPHERLHVALELWGDHFRIQNVTGLDDQKRWGAGAAIEFKVNLVRRGTEGPVGVTLILAPHYSNSEEVTGEKAHHWALETKLAADVELIKDMLLLAVNFHYEPAKVKARGEEEWEKESTFGAAVALMGRMTQNVLFGGEVSYERAYEGYALDTLAGRALYVGPVLHVRISDKANFVAGWQTQVWGKAVGDSRSLDLENFDRHRARVLYSQHF